MGFDAEGSGSLIDLSSLAAFTPGGGSNWLTVESQATVLDPNLKNLQDVAVTLDGTGTMATNQWVSLTGGGLTVTGGSYTAAFDGLTDIDASSLAVQNGAYLSLPMVAGFANSTSNSATWVASGAGSTLSLPGLQGLGAINNSPPGLAVQALQGGQVNLSALASVGGLSTGVQFQADGSGTQNGQTVHSQIDLSSLTALIPGGSNNSLRVTNGGVLLDPKLKTERGGGYPGRDRNDGGRRVGFADRQQPNGDRRLVHLPCADRHRPIQLHVQGGANVSLRGGAELFQDVDPLG